MLHCIFGEKQAGASYRTRPGAYLIAVSGAQIASIRTPKGFFLPGGGVEPGETHEACILRECLEETGFLVQVGCRIAERTQIRAPGLNGQPGEPGKTPKTPQVQQKSVEANPKKKKKIAAQ